MKLYMKAIPFILVGLGLLTDLYYLEEFHVAVRTVIQFVWKIG